MYYKYFDNIDDTSDEWVKIFFFIEKYIKVSKVSRSIEFRFALKNKAKLSLELINKTIKYLGV